MFSSINCYWSNSTLCRFVRGQKSSSNLLSPLLNNWFLLRLWQQDHQSSSLAVSDLDLSHYFLTATWVFSIELYHRRDWYVLYTSYIVRKVPEIEHQATLQHHISAVSSNMINEDTVNSTMQYQLRQHNESLPKQQQDGHFRCRKCTAGIPE